VTIKQASSLLYGHDPEDLKRVHFKDFALMVGLYLLSLPASGTLSWSGQNRPTQRLFSKEEILKEMSQAHEKHLIIA
jgi:hypothetical protein